MASQTPIPGFTIETLTNMVGPLIYLRGADLFRFGEVGKIKTTSGSQNERVYQAYVQGSRQYTVRTSSHKISRADRSTCTCPMGEKKEICKHIIALGLAVLHRSYQAYRSENPPSLDEVKDQVSEGFLYIYGSPDSSSVYFLYQRDLAMGGELVVNAIESLSANMENAKYVWRVICSLSDKLAHEGIDDSDGVVRGYVDILIDHLVAYAETSKELRRFLQGHCTEKTGFGFEDDLQEQLKQN